MRTLFMLLALLVFWKNTSGQVTVPSTKNAVTHARFRVVTDNPADATDHQKAQTSIQYSDGLGRPSQTVGYRATPNATDLTTGATVYDNYGRAFRTVLPAPSPTNSGAFNSDVQASAAAFYNDLRPFNEVTAYDGSPLNRPSQTLGPGKAWADADKNTQLFYETAAPSTVRRYFYKDGAVQLNQYYPPNSLRIDRQVDEQGSTSLTYTDTRGRVIQKVQQGDTGTLLVTAYVYDYLDRLRAVVQPEGYALNVGFGQGDANFANYVFYYDYNSLGNIARKHVPGAGWTNFVYDKADRVVLEQSALQAQSNKWNFTKYDVFGRVTVQGELVSGSTQSSLQTAFEAVSNPYELWDGVNKSYSANSFPTGFTNVVEQLINYYDQYDFVANNLPVFQSGAYHAQYPDAKGLPTGSSVLNGANPPQRLYSVMYYDNKGRVIQTHQTHVKGGGTPSDNPIRTDYEYNFAGEITKEKVLYQIAGQAKTTKEELYTYDHVGRKIQSDVRLNGSSLGVVAYNYDQVGRLQQKVIRAASSGGVLLSLKAYLQGSLYGVSLPDVQMRDDLRTKNLIPSSSPYAAGLDFQVLTPTGSVAPSVFSATGADAIIDWVFIELRTGGTDRCELVDARSALIQRDGDVVDLDGSSPVFFPRAQGGNYYVVLRHRNHLGVMTKEPISLSAVATTVDFRSTTTVAYTITTSAVNQAQVAVAQGLALWAGNALFDGRVIYQGNSNDVNPIYQLVLNDAGNVFRLPQYKLRGYRTGDIDMNGETVFQGTGNDQEFIYQNIIKNHPGNGLKQNFFIIREQLPTCPAPLRTAPFSTAPTAATIQTMDYSYHIRGGLRGMNLDASGNAVPNASQGDLFSFKLDYETAGQWDGNIGKQTWKNDTEAQRSYVYSYDPAKRLKTADYTGVGSEDFSIPPMSYDKNGNITNLQRKGVFNGSTYDLIDNLTYNYGSSGNRLQGVTDGVNGNTDTGDFRDNGSNSDYTYHPDGSLKSDANEQIQNIVYDTFLKQPTAVVLTDGRKIRHFYDGGGRLIKTVYYDAANAVLETWEYVGQLIFKNGVPYQMSTPEGRAAYNGSSWEYEFEYKDHLGNTRVAFKAQNGQLLKTAETAFGPWGLKLAGVGSVNGFQNRWELQGKEREQTFGLNRVNFGARVYNPTIGRFDRIDPLADHPQQLRFSPYVFSSNNPINRIDPDGNMDFGVKDWIKFANGSVGFDRNIKAQAGQTVTSHGQQGISLGASAVLSNGNQTISLNSNGLATNAIPLNEVSVVGKSGSLLGTIDNIADAVDLSNNLNTVVIAGASKLGNALEAAAPAVKVLDNVASDLGVTGAIISTAQAIENPTAGNVLKAGVDIGLAALKVNPVTGAVIGIADGILSVTGAKDAFFKGVDNKVDQYQSNQVMQSQQVDTSKIKFR